MQANHLIKAGKTLNRKAESFHQDSAFAFFLVYVNFKTIKIYSPLLQPAASDNVNPYFLRMFKSSIPGPNIASST